MNYNNIEKFKNNNEISNIKLLSNITLDSYTCFFYYTFIAFKTFDNLYYLIYTSEDNSIICFDLNKNQKISQIKKINKENISTLRHYSDVNNRQDIVITISPININLRLWNVKNWQCILYINKVYHEGALYSALILNKNNINYLITSNCNYFGDSELIKIFDFEGNKIKEIKDSNDATLFIDIYYDKIYSKNFIITGNKNYLKSFDYDKNNLYHKYFDNFNGAHSSFIVYDKNKIIKILDLCEDGNLRIWNFHSGILLNKIEISKKSLYCLCLWNDNTLLIGCQDKEIKILDLQNNEIIKSLTGHNNYVITIKKVNHINYGDCLISHGFEKDQIKLWSFPVKS